MTVLKLIDCLVVGKLLANKIEPDKVRISSFSFKHEIFKFCSWISWFAEPFYGTYVCRITHV